MKRKSFLFISILVFCSLSGFANPSGKQDRELWVKTLDKIADPVLTNLANNTLDKNMPFETLDQSGTRHKFSRLEAAGRLISGIAPWLELGPDYTPEGKLRAKYIYLAVKGIQNAVNPKAPDFMDFNKGSQPLVDAAFLAEGLLRAKNELWKRLDYKSKINVILALKSTRAIEPGHNNWLLFSSMVEAAILEFTGKCDVSRLTYGVYKFRDEWYKGDGVYGDGRMFHMDYYNSFVIHPMLTEVLKVMQRHKIVGYDFLTIESERMGRYAALLEKQISPEGTYPVYGRSITYRFGVFHALADAALLNYLPASLPAAQVRCALTAVIQRQMKGNKNFDKNGWLRVGFTGSQINMAETYINTGSEYLCSEIFLPLGLPSKDKFWSDPYMEWTNLKAWNGTNIEADHSISN